MGLGRLGSGKERPRVRVRPGPALGSRKYQLTRPPLECPTRPQPPPQAEPCTQLPSVASMASAPCNPPHIPSLGPEGCQHLGKLRLVTGYGAATRSMGQGCGTRGSCLATFFGRTSDLAPLHSPILAEHRLHAPNAVQPGMLFRQG